MPSAKANVRASTKPTELSIRVRPTIRSVRPVKTSTLCQI
jgi:hypothetical protein